ncbi:MAG: DUF1273 family protein [Alistipes sp.]|nr:DUF1273 family protein [Alistipes sp.]
MALTQRERCVAFTGHRSYNGEHNVSLRRTIIELYNEGYDTFLCGMAIGFDMIAAEVLLDLRKMLPHLRLICVIPFEGQQESFSPDKRERFNAIVAQADSVITLQPKYSVGAYHGRNDYLVSNASVVVAYFTGESGGTAYTVKRAVKMGRRLINLHLNPQQMFDFR